MKSVCVGRGEEIKGVPFDGLPHGEDAWNQLQTRGGCRFSSLLRGRQWSVDRLATRSSGGVAVCEKKLMWPRLGPIVGDVAHWLVRAERNCLVLVVRWDDDKGRWRRRGSA